jgi:hypothetical protein
MSSSCDDLVQNVNDSDFHYRRPFFAGAAVPSNHAKTSDLRNRRYRPMRRAGNGLRDRARHFSWTHPGVTRNNAATSSGVKISDNVSGVLVKGRLLFGPSGGAGESTEWLTKDLTTPSRERSLRLDGARGGVRAGPTTMRNQHYNSETNVMEVLCLQSL